MKFCSKCGNELVDEAVVCTKCGCAVVSSTPQTSSVVNQDDEVSIGFCVLSVLVPLFGVIYWAVKNKETPKRAKACGIAGLVSWGVSLIFSILWSAIFSSMFVDIMSSLY
jgi:uncharacterized membrane protein YvbJ